MTYRCDVASVVFESEDNTRFNDLTAMFGVCESALGDL